VRNAIDLAHAFGVAQPRVAILAAVETINPHMPATLDAGALCKMADRGQIEGAILDGPLAFDNAVSAAAARTKGIVSEVAGAADILVVPDLESGNMLPSSSCTWAARSARESSSGRACPSCSRAGRSARVAHRVVRGGAGSSTPAGAGAVAGPGGAAIEALGNSREE
jgi:hypothetical protein